jgi:hypothetical protein
MRTVTERCLFLSEAATAREGRSRFELGTLAFMEDPEIVLQEETERAAVAAIELRLKPSEAWE